ISSVVGTLMMVAVVAVIGSVILFQGLNGINDFNFYLSFLTGSKDIHENAIIEHIRFNPTTSQLDVWVRNTGTVQLEITKITVVRMDNQELILDTNPQATVSINDSELITQNPLSPPSWNTAPYDTAEYKISITTQLGKSFETTATPYNT
ncbi:MAG: hypothetical protein ACT4N5_07380, partial [Nitrosopumilaceae archaeon]